MRPCFNGMQLRIRNPILLILHTNILATANLILLGHGNVAINRHGRMDANKLPEYPNVRFDGAGRFAIHPPSYRCDNPCSRSSTGGDETSTQIVSK